MINLVEEVVYDQNSIAQTNLKDSHFLECHFKKISFSFKDLRGSNFQECRFSECNLSGSLLTGTSFISTKFYNCKVVGTNFSVSDQLFELDFNQSIIHLSSFQNLKSSIHFFECDLKGSDLSDSKLKGSSFRKCNLNEVTFSNSDLTMCDFREASNYYIDLRSEKVSKSKFSSPEVLGLLESFNISIE